jgi:hypothetical protein
MATSVGHQAKEDQPHSSMMAWRVHEFGPPNVMRFEQVLRPTPGPSEVLVKVEGAGVGPWDGWIRAGKSALPQPLPSLWALICLVKSSPWGPGFLACVWEIRFMVLRILSLSGPMPSMLWLSQRWYRGSQPR